MPTSSRKEVAERKEDVTIEGMYSMAYSFSSSCNYAGFFHSHKVLLMLLKAFRVYLKPLRKENLSMLWKT